MQLPPTLIAELLIMALISIVMVVYTVTLFAMQKLHTNCKVLLLLWLLSYYLLVCSQIAMAIWRIATDRMEMMSRAQGPDMVYFMLVNTFGYAMSTSTEVAIMIERIIAVRHAGNYKTAPCALFFVIVVVVSANFVLNRYTCTKLVMRKMKATISLGYGYIYQLARGIIPMMIPTIVTNAIDISLIGISRGIHVYSRRQYRRLNAHAGLIGRYHLNEVYELTEAILPVTIVSVLFKAISYLGNYSYIFGLQFPYYILVSYSLTMLNINACVCMALLLFRLRFLREKFVELFVPAFLYRRFFASEVVRLSRDQQSDIYFDNLRAEWK